MLKKEKKLYNLCDAAIMNISKKVSAEKGWKRISGLYDMGTVVLCGNIWFA